MDKMKIEIWSDIACPYCYIGKRKLENALSKVIGSENIELIWNSYELNPSLDKRPLEKNYFGYISEIHHITEDDAKQDFENIINTGKPVGIAFRPEIVKITNTSDALRLIKLADKYNLADRAEEALFKAYFEEGKDISDTETLVLTGSEIGVPRNDILRMLNSHEYSDAIKDDMYRSENELGLEYIPFYLINNKYIIQGAIGETDYIKTITEAYSDWKINGTPDNTPLQNNAITGQSCSIDGVCN